MRNTGLARSGLGMSDRLILQSTSGHRSHGEPPVIIKSEAGPIPTMPETDFSGFIIRVGSSSTPIAVASTRPKIVRCSTSFMPQYPGL